MLLGNEHVDCCRSTTASPQGQLDSRSARGEPLRAIATVRGAEKGRPRWRTATVSRLAKSSPTAHFALKPASRPCSERACVRVSISHHGLGASSPPRRAHEHTDAAGVHPPAWRRRSAGCRRRRGQQPLVSRVSTDAAAGGSARVWRAPPVQRGGRQCCAPAFGRAAGGQASRRRLSPGASHGCGASCGGRRGRAARPGGGGSL